MPLGFCFRARFAGRCRSGKSRHGIPVFSPYRIALSISRLLLPGRPPCGFFSGGNKSLILFHYLSLISCLFMCSILSFQHFTHNPLVFLTSTYLFVIAWRHLPVTAKVQNSGGSDFSKPPEISMLKDCYTTSFSFVVVRQLFWIFKTKLFCSMLTIRTHRQERK